MVNDEDPSDFVVRLRLPFMPGDLLVKLTGTALDGVNGVNGVRPWDEWSGVKASECHRAVSCCTVLYRAVCCTWQGKGCGWTVFNEPHPHYQYIHVCMYTPFS